MKFASLLCAAALLSAPAVVASSPLEGLKFEQQKQQVIKDIKAACKPKTTLSDNDFANKVLASEDNKLNVRNATLELERNNKQGYKEAIGKVKCPAL
ncbi:YicS family protein [[Enterobacter] lignolyticus]|uniref:Uncharacterized protein YicS n=2 Tax=[Enterobacter] lignolyticus TaxID=1334193 RepID=E3G8D8_ENTLS|nr:YicS family protein [[Enterobacter] lignolyticus]ADO46327.1 putative secreted protein [[Enterobacter] lignolyticus SCF1]ALR78710.1 hypothetical protein AO703_21240 [[Enterobacter] lignolyticus]